MVTGNEKFFTVKCYIFIDFIIVCAALFYGYLLDVLFVGDFDVFDKIIGYTGIFVLILGWDLIDISS